MYVLGTAGHVDHGKSTLVKALTGIDPDRLKEEKNRQMTIDLGFAWYQLPSGNEVGIVDVPGHRDFIENMLAGIGGIDAVLFIIAAGEGVMPQTREHLAILKLLQINKGVIVLTKIDQVEDKDWIALVEEDVRNLMQGTFLADAPILRVSALEGIGLEELAGAIDDMLSSSEPKRDRGKPRLPIDRVFTLKGFGTVVTGTLVDGEFALGQQVELLPGKLEARIRGIQNHKKKVEIAYPGNRTAINLTGINPDQIRRGNVLVNPSTYSSSRRVDARVEMLAEANGKINHNDHLKCFIGSDQAIVRIRVIGKKEISPGDWGWIQMEFDEPVVAEKGDRFILRRPSPPETIAGGMILDARPPKRHKRFSDDVIARMGMMEAGSHEQILLSTLDSGGIIQLGDLIKKSGIEEDIAREEIKRLIGNEIVSIGSESNRNILLCTRTYWQTLINEISGELTNYYKKHPLRFGISKLVLNQKLKLDSKVYNLILQKLISEQILEESGSEIGLKDHDIVFSEADEKNAQTIIQAFEANPYSPPILKELVDEYGDDLVDALIAVGGLTRISENIALLPETYQTMLQAARDFLGKEQKITLAQFRDMFGTSRKYALAFLEHMDNEGITIRKENYRVLK